jgi:hypothetical protein
MNSQNHVFMKLDDMLMKPDQGMMIKERKMTSASTLIKVDPKVTSPLPCAKQLD